MPRPNQSPERRLEFIPILAATFAEFGYRRTTTAQLAERCGVRENILYRLWADKRAMFVAALDHVYELSETTWHELLAKGAPDSSPAELIVDYEATHHGEFGLYRIVFAGLSETDDPEIAEAMGRLYRQFQDFLLKQVSTHREGVIDPPAVDAEWVAWGIIGLGTVANIGRELELFSGSERERLVRAIGHLLLGERQPED